MAKVRIKTDISNLKEIFDSLDLKKDAPKLSLEVDLDIKETKGNYKFLCSSDLIEDWRPLGEEETTGKWSKIIEDRESRYDFLEDLKETVNFKNITEILYLSYIYFSESLNLEKEEDQKKLIQDYKDEKYKDEFTKSDINPIELVQYVLKNISRVNDISKDWYTRILKYKQFSFNNFQEFMIALYVSFD